MSIVSKWQCLYRWRYIHIMQWSRNPEIISTSIDKGPPTMNLQVRHYPVRVWPCSGQFSCWKQADRIRTMQCWNNSSNELTHQTLFDLISNYLTWIVGGIAKKILLQTYVRWWRTNDVGALWQEVHVNQDRWKSEFYLIIRHAFRRTDVSTLIHITAADEGIFRIPKISKSSKVCAAG